MSQRYLLDTCVISEFVKPRPEPRVIEWLNSFEMDNAHLSAVTIGEIQCGISNLAASNRRTELEVWLSEELVGQFNGRIIPLDAKVFVVWGKMAAARKQKGEPMSVMDSLIAATALRHDMVLVTRNTSDFKDVGLSLFNPWA
ncbi:MAG: type II toxin-antitoxin system VapC family toxin [Desulfomicrobium sp.]|nr:type II toxin-antitoxin system VapC family toxin [Pseudomonadota bacterium]MBV1713515.1 type II toxin-antitoxin system VapC family toxin [Desulfomicrobium sp.]MBU4572051.1 type II toxin-antitoxin system VapC family toxin [Pseudomonadota bacterium]MBU4594029.1 type II toxin-antitoxin system VapC family toxin [Pseudomonadota bacterium]MBV1721020.1 type II toxin-antitoxin system VapC family toxin [Desulfomicrobium sp.]